MTLHEFPRLGERYWEQRLENGLLLRVVPKPGFARSYAFLGVDYGSIDTSFTRGGVSCRTPDGVAHYLEHKMFDLPEDNAMNLFAAHGGYPNAFTGYAMTAYYFECTEQFAENLPHPAAHGATHRGSRRRAWKRSAASSRRKSGCMRTAPTPAPMRTCSARCFSASPHPRSDRRNGGVHRRDHAAGPAGLPMPRSTRPQISCSA